MTIPESILQAMRERRKFSWLSKEAEIAAKRILRRWWR